MTPEILQHPTHSDPRARVVTFADWNTRNIDDARALIDYTGNDDSEDRYGSIVDPRGANTEAYMRTGAGVVLFAHKYDAPPVGKTTKLTKTAKALNFRVQFAVNQSPFAREIYELVRDGFMPAVSIGFIPKASVPHKATTTGTAYAENVRYTEWELLELSVVPVPANRNALKKAYADGRISDRTVILAGLRQFLDGGSALTTMRRRPERPVGMAEDLYEAALSAGISPATALRIQALLRRRDVR